MVLDLNTGPVMSGIQRYPSVARSQFFFLPLFFFKKKASVAFGL